MAGEYWTLKVFKHDRGPNTDILEKKIERNNICYSNLIRLLETEGYEASDELFFTSSDTYCCGTLTKIEGETHVKDMIMENDKSKMADLHLFKAIQRTPFSPLKIDNVKVIAGSSQQEDNIDYNPELIGVADDQHSISSGDTDHEQEKVDYVEKLNEMKRQREDPMTHCEGDTDIDDLYTPEDADVDLGVVDIDDMSCELSHPPSEDGGLSTLECETDEENKPPPGKRRRGKGIQVQSIYFDESNMMDTSQLCKGMCFTDAGQFRKALKSYHIVKGRDYKYTRNKADRIKVKCSQDKVKCDFFIRASQVGSEKTFMVREMIAPHTCPSHRNCTRVDSTWLSERYEDDFRSDPNWKVEAFMARCLRETCTYISKSKAYRARRKATEKVLGNKEKQYKRIRDYLQTLIDTNPGTTAVVTTINRDVLGLAPRFSGLFICFSAQKEGFINGCMPFISIDGCFVKLTNGAQVLAASARDGNNNMFPIAFAVVGKEDTDSWTWFLEMLKCTIGSGEEHGGWTFMSDRQKGLMNAIPIVFPDSEHRYCKRHLLQNMGNKGWRGEKYKGFVDATIYATTVWDYDKAMEDIKKLNLKAWEWLIAIGKEHFSRHAFSPKAKSDLVVNNLSEVFNKYILDARDKPIVTMVEHIRRKVMAGHTPEDYVVDYFRKDAYMRTYTAVIYPVPDEHSWTKTDSPDIDPPKFDKHVGRPKKSRRKGPDEGPRVQGPARKTTSTCSNCRRDGHTYRTCGKPLRPNLQLRAANIKARKRGVASSSHENSNEAPSLGMIGGRGSARGRPSARGRSRGRLNTWFSTQ
ncbi:uncharacterized protein [Oryza sativa Japonica Group]|uniref:uncharacterized protein n=1 Tax=Oryza sativa subsp. japonica TaxID=39947 RepID=UPI0000F17CF1